MYGKYYNLIFFDDHYKKNNDTLRLKVGLLKDSKNAAEDNQKKAKKRINQLETSLYTAKKEVQKFKNNLEKGCKKRTEVIKIIAKAENNHFECEKKWANEAKAPKAIAKEKATDMKKQAKIAKKCTKGTEKQSQELETKKVVTYKEGVYDFLFSTWL